MRSTVRVVAGLCLLACLVGRARGQDEGELTAKKRWLPTVGPGLRAVKRGANGTYYVLAAPGSSAAAFDANGKLLKRIPAYEEGQGPQSAELRAVTFGEDLDVDAQGTVYVADRGANAIKIWSATGDARKDKVPAPVAVAALPDGEFAVSTLHEPHLVIVYDKNGRDVREFGDPEQISERPELNRFLNIGILVTDGGEHLFYGFPYLPEATVREYDRFGYAGQDFQFTGIDAWPAAQATRREIVKQEKKGNAPIFKRILTAVGVERGSGEVWMALGNNLLHFDKDGNRRASYLMYTPEGARLEANTILVEPERLIIGSDPLGIYEFEKPKKFLNNK